MSLQNDVVALPSGRLNPPQTMSKEYITSYSKSQGFFDKRRPCSVLHPKAKALGCRTERLIKVNQSTNLQLLQLPVQGVPLVIVLVQDRRQLHHKTH